MTLVIYIERRSHRVVVCCPALLRQSYCNSLLSCTIEPHLLICYRALIISLLDLVWSLSNDSLLSCSMDGTSRLWNVASASCIRVIPNPTGAEVLCCRFQPLNNNLFVVSLYFYIIAVNQNCLCHCKNNNLTNH